MPRITAVGALLTFISTLAWAARLVFGDSRWESDAAALLAATLVILGAIVAFASLLAPSRWVRNAATGVTAVGGALALVLDIDGLWIAAALTGFGGVALLWARPSDRWFRGSTKPEPVPTPAVVLALGLVVMPGVIAAATPDNVAGLAWVAAGGSLVLGWAYARALPWTVWLARLAYPLLTIAAAVVVGGPGGLVIAVAGLGLTALAWTSGARLAAEPLTPRSAETVSILPEMVPAELMESAGYDTKGRPKETN